MPRGRPHLTSNFPMISRGSSYPEENDRDIRGAIHGDRMAAPESTLIIQRHIPCRVAIHGDRMGAPESTPIIHGDRMTFPEPDSHPGSDQAKSSIYAFH